jgi:hypothetical protein
MKLFKIFITTYKRSDILNDTLDKLFNSDLSSFNNENIDVYILNNHSNFYLDKSFLNRVKVIHNEARPDWSNGNLSENWNQALINGFKDLSSPDAEHVITLQNDTVVDSNCFNNLLKLRRNYDFIVGEFGDNFVCYTPEAVKKIGIWDENFAHIQYKEADYWIRALIFNKDKSYINDTLHGLCLNNQTYYRLDTQTDRNFVEVKSFKESLLNQSGKLKRKADDNEHAEIWKTRGGIYKEHAWRYFCYKWSGTWIEEPKKEGWIKNWKKEFIENPPNFAKSKVKIFYRYIYFEKDIYDLYMKNYLI